MSEVAFFDKIAKYGEVSLARPRGVPLPVWEDLQEQKAKSNEKASTSINPPPLPKHLKFNERKRLHHKKKLFKKIKLADG